MNRTGANPEQHQAGAFWLRDLFEKTRLAEHVRHTLELDVVEYQPDVRAAAWVLGQLGFEHVWPSERLIHDLRLARVQLRRMLATGLEPDVAAAVRAELATLAKRIDAE